jgi:ABC-type phosphate transport system substrate-binding protein
MRITAKRVNMMRTAGRIRCLTLLLVCVSYASLARAQDVVLVVNKGVQISQISAADLRAIFTGEKTRFADGSHAVPVILKGGPAHEVFLKNHLGQSPDEFRVLWRKAVFTGEGSMPKTFPSETALIEYVAATPGAIGYVSRVSPQDNVKSLTLQK